MHSVIVTVDHLNPTKIQMLQSLASCGCKLTIAVDSKAYEASSPILEREVSGATIQCVSNDVLCETYGSRNCSTFNGRWSNNPAKLAALHLIAEGDAEFTWYFEDDVYSEHWLAFMDTYIENPEDLITTMFTNNLRRDFREFAVNGWLVGNPDHMRYGVAGLYVFRMSKRLAMHILYEIEHVRHCSHHELFVPWVARSKGFTLGTLSTSHSQYMRHNLDPRLNSGLRISDLPRTGTIHHPVKHDSVAIHRQDGVLNAPKVKLHIVINTFNDEDYITQACALANEIEEQLSEMIPVPQITLAIGGCDEDDVISCCRTYVRSRKNMSDYGALLAIRRCVNDGLMSPEDRCLLLHDTTWPKQRAFINAMLDLQNAPINEHAFMFAHPLGWYNIGVGPAAFLMRFASAFDRVSCIPKQVAYALEHGGEHVTHEGTRLPSLRMFSKVSIGAHRVDVSSIPACANANLTMHSTGAVNFMGKSRVVVYLASLGLFKFTHGPTSYQVPVWSNADIATDTAAWKKMRKEHPTWQHGMDWALPLVSIDLAPRNVNVRPELFT